MRERGRQNTQRLQYFVALNHRARIPLSPTQKRYSYIDHSTREVKVAQRGLPLNSRAAREYVPPSRQVF
jgi:hypothetical protein